MSEKPIPKDPYHIIGLTTGKDDDGNWPVRRDIDEMMKSDDKQTRLTFAAFYLISKEKATEQLSYFQLAGIHGYPNKGTPWPREDGPGEGFYCEHSHATFTTWHRVYVALFEQALGGIIQEIVKFGTRHQQEPWLDKFIPKPSSEEEQGAWKHAADTWRLPYWDPAVRRAYNDNGACIPEVMLFDKVDSVPIPVAPLPGFPIHNPYYAYPFPDNLAELGMDNVGGAQGVVIPTLKQTRTVRYCNTYDPKNEVSVKDWEEGRGSMEKLKDAMLYVTAQWRQELSLALLENQDFNNFSIGKASEPTEEGTVKATLIIPNLNSFHGVVHDLTGGDLSDIIGPKNNTPTNGNMAHVPVAGFDPIFFFWHAGVDRYIAMWQAGHPGEDPKYWLTQQEDQAPLYPFVDSSGNWWRSKNCRQVNSLGYNYEILDDIKNKDDLERTTGRLYSDLGPGIPREPVEYLAVATFEPNEIGPWRLLLYLPIGKEQHIVGRIVNFVSPLGAGCENCERGHRERRKVYSGTVISTLIRALKQRYGVQDDIEKLVEQVGWKVVDNQGRETTVPSLTVAFCKRINEFLDLPDTDIPKTVLRDVHLLHDVTDGKKSGLPRGRKYF